MDVSGRSVRWGATAGIAVVMAAGLPAGAAQADDITVIHAPGLTLIRHLELDDPMEDVLEHTLNFGNGPKGD